MKSILTSDHYNRKVKKIKRMKREMNIRFAEETDVSLILKLTKELVEYENLSSEVVASEDTLNKSIFKEKKVEVIIGEIEG